MGWLLVALMLGAVAVAARRDPRRLWIAIVLTIAVGLGLVGATAHVVLALVDSDDPVALAWVLLGVIGLAFAALVVLGLFNVANGVTMIRREARRPATLLSLALGVAVLAYCALVVAFWFEDQRQSDVALPLFLVLVGLGLPAMYLAFVFVAFVGYGLLYGWAVRRWARPVDVVVVLGAGLRGADVTPLLASRLRRGREVLERSRARGRDTHLICSGGQGPDEVVPEAVAMADHLVREGVGRDLLWLEDRSTTTEENLAFSRQVARDHDVEDCRFAVVTNDFHVMRAALLMRTVGLSGYATGSPTARYFWPSATLREFAAILRDHAAVHAVVLFWACLPLVTYVVTRWQ